MNYRHIYHAGNFADLAKHLVLVAVLRRLLEKDTPIAFLDTHAGAGLYELGRDEAARSGEAVLGIGKLHLNKAPPALQPLLSLVSQVNRGTWAPNAPPRRYPGSPKIAALLLRPQDRLVACELHPADSILLRKLFAEDSRATIHRMDGYQALKAYLPPKERRGLVLIDPPFEAPDEFDRLAAGLGRAVRKWPTGVFLAWYPQKEAAGVQAFLAKLAQHRIRKLLHVTFAVAAPSAERLSACGMLLVNPPWRVEGEIEPALNALVASLQAPGGCVGLEWLAGDATTGAATV
jgi:23S rRNA (adenine2030-N6)-methyltransferase